MNMIKKTVMWAAAALLLPVTQAVATPVAKVGDTEYSSVEAAYEAATAGQTITLADDATLVATLVVSKKVTLDLSTFTLTAAAGCNAIDVAKGGDLTIKADATDPGTISCDTGKRCVFTDNYSDHYYGWKKIRIEGGVFNGVCEFNPWDGKQSFAQGQSVDLSISGGTFNEEVLGYRCYYFEIKGGTFEKRCECGVNSTYHSRFMGGKFRVEPGSNSSDDIGIGYDSSGVKIRICNAVYYKDGYFHVTANAADYAGAVAKVGTTCYYFSLADAFAKAKTTAGDKRDVVTLIAPVDFANTVLPLRLKVAANGQQTTGKLVAEDGYAVTYDATTKTYSSAEAVAKIGDTTYATLAEALKAAQSGDTVEIIKADEYDWPNAITKGIAIKGAVDGVTFPCGKNCTSGLEDVTLINLNLPFGQENYCGFTHCSNLVFDGCTISGLSNSYGPQTYRNCTFNQSKVEYCMWVYGNHVVYDGCTFNTWGKALNVCAESAVGYTLLVKDCTFNNEHDAVKPAVLIKSLRGAVELEYDVDIENCTIVGNWPDAEHPYADGQIQTCGLWDVKDTGKKISVTLDGALVWVNGAMPPVKIGNQGYATLSNAVEAVQNGETITLQKDNAEVFTADTAALFTIDPNGFAFTATNVTPREGCELVQNLDGTYAYRMQVVVKDQITKIVVEPKDEAVTETETKSAAVTVSGETAKEVLEGTKTVEFVVAGFGTVSFSPAAAKRLGLNMEKVADEAGGSVTGASSESTVTIGGADITDSPTATTPTVIIDEEEHETYEVVQAISLTAIGEAIVKQAGSSATVRTNDEVFAEGKTAEGETATWTIPYSGVKPQVWFINTTKETWTTNKVATTYNAETKKLTFVLNHFSDYSITDVEISAIVGAEKFRTLQEAFDFVTNKTEGTEVRLVKNSTATAKLAAGVMATLNLNDKTLKGSVTAGDGAILTVGDGTIDAGEGTFANGEGSGKVNIVSGTYKGAFPNESATTNVFVSGGWFQAPVPAANCAPGYVPKAEPEEGMYTVKNANIYIRDIGACQRYPWNGYVDITVDVCWDANKTAKLYVTAWDKLTGEQLKMTGAELFEEGVEGSRSVDCAKGFVVEASQKKTLHLIWNSVEGVPKGYRKDRVGFGFAAKKTK